MIDKKALLFLSSGLFFWNQIAKEAFEEVHTIGSNT
jgi:hypothetical protein